MQSRVISMFPYQKVDITPFKRKPAIDEEKLQKELDRVVYPYITWSDGDVAGMGDVVECSMASADKRFERVSARITVGAGLLDREEEKKLVGQKVGAALALVCRGSEVSLTILSVKKKCVPPLTDAMVAAMGIAGVETAEQYRGYLVKQMLDEQFPKDSYEAIQSVLRTVRQRSEVLITQEDWQQTVDWDLNRLAVIARLDGMELEKMTAKEFEGRIPVQSYYELVAMLQRDAWQNTWQMLLGQKLAEEDGFAVTEAQYEAFLADLARSWNSTVEAYRPAYPYAYYEAIQYRIHYYDAVSDYIRSNIYWEE